MVQLANLQSALAHRSLKSVYAVLLFNLAEAQGGRAFLRSILARVTAGDVVERDGVPLLNVFMSWRTLSLLAEAAGLDASEGRRKLEPHFTDPLQAPDSVAMADQLGFTGASHPHHWWGDFNTLDIDFAVYIGSDTPQSRLQVVEEVRKSAVEAGLRELAVTSFPNGFVEGYLPPGGKLHFDYRDGITSPDVDWSDEGDPRRVNLREFVLGYRTMDYPTAPYRSDAWNELVRDGSFACMTWIYQDAAGFEAFLSEGAKSVSPPSGADPKEWLAAHLMGRWRDGSPLAKYPDAPPAKPDLTDDFGYADDPAGVRCPLNAHVRIAFSRDQPLSFGNSGRFPKGPPRLIRRGFSYGERLSSEVDDGEDRGLFGVFLCARINEQFYSILRWMQQTEFSDVFDHNPPGRAFIGGAMANRGWVVWVVFIAAVCVIWLGVNIFREARKPPNPRAEEGE